MHTEFVQILTQIVTQKPLRCKQQVKWEERSCRQPLVGERNRACTSNFILTNNTS